MQLTNLASSNANKCICTREYGPICASNGVTYSNGCEFKCAKVENKHLEIQFYGECNGAADTLPIEEADCICTLELFPVCANNDQTYSNECMLKCAQRKQSDLRLKNLGECGKEIRIPNEVAQMDSITEQCFCPFNFAPICATDGQTYSNECEFDCQKKINNQLEVRYSGECRDATQILSIPTDRWFQCACPLIYMPVCGSDDNSYSNECDLNCAKKRNANLNIKHQGKCDSIDIFPVKEFQKLPIVEQQCICPLILDFVCGTDKNDYDNICLLDCAKKTRSDLTVKHYGSCN